MNVKTVGYYIENSVKMSYNQSTAKHYKEEYLWETCEEENI